MRQKVHPNPWISDSPGLRARSEYPGAQRDQAGSRGRSSRNRKDGPSDDRLDGHAGSRYDWHLIAGIPLRCPAMMRSWTRWIMGMIIIVGGILAGLTLHGHAESTQHSNTPECRADTVGITEVLDFRSATRLFEHAGVTALGEEWVVAGTEGDAAWDTPDDVAASSRQPRIVQRNKGQLSIPHRDSQLPMELPIPVAISDTQWGLVWAEAQPFPGFQGQWIPTVFTRLWLAEHEPDGWHLPRQILKSKLGISWETNRTIVPRKGQGTLLMVVASETLAKRHITFGSISRVLNRIELPSEITPWVATFILEKDGSVVIIAQVKPTGTAPVKGPLVMMQLPQGSTSIAAIDTIWHDSEVARLRAHRDRKGTVHVLWTDHDNHLYHIAREPKQSGWISYDTPLLSGIATKWVSGVDRCGRVAVIAHVLYASTDHDFEITHREGASWSPLQEAFPGFYGLSLFDGIDQDGNWYVGWSGKRKEYAKSGTIKVWLARP